MEYSKEKLIEYIPLFIEALSAKLIEDQKRWGDTWKNRPIEGQSERIRATYDNYFDQEKHGGQDVDWLAVTGNALIAWIRDYEAKNLEARIRT